jgi:hypothetical protein
MEVKADDLAIAAATLQVASPSDRSGKLLNLFPLRETSRTPSVPEYNSDRNPSHLISKIQVDPMGKAAPELHELLERKGCSFVAAPDYYCFGKDDEWKDKLLGERPLMCVYNTGTWKASSWLYNAPETELEHFVPENQRSI